MEIERRFINDAGFQAELRIEERAADKVKTIVGYPAKFNKLSQNLGGFRENILPGTFKRTLAEGADVRGLINHNPDLILGRTTSGTMTLREDEVGLRMVIEPPDTQAARDLVTSIARRDIDQGSFRFRTKSDNWRMQDGETIRDLIDVDLLDVSVVTFPAYEDTSASVRSIGEIVGLLDTQRLSSIMIRTEKKLPVDDLDRAFLRQCIEAVERAEVTSMRWIPTVEMMKMRLELARRLAF